MFQINSSRLGKDTFLRNDDYLNKYVVKEAKIISQAIQGRKVTITVQYPDMSKDQYSFDKSHLKTHQNMVHDDSRIHTYSLNGKDLIGVTSIKEGLSGDITSKF